MPAATVTGALIRFGPLIHINEKAAPFLRAALSGATIYEHLMPRDGAIIFSDLIGKLDVLRVACDKCGRAGRYRLNHLIESRGRDAKLVDWLDEITAGCQQKAARNWSDQCAARCPDLPKLL